jgi:hypothetical protein
MSCTKEAPECSRVILAALLKNDLARALMLIGLLENRHGILRLAVSTMTKSALAARPSPLSSQVKPRDLQFRSIRNQSRRNVHPSTPENELSSRPSEA